MRLGMKICALVPTRGDRKKLLDFNLKRLEEQSVKPDFVVVVDDAPSSDKKDITYRYRIGSERAISRGADVVLLIEDDDYYSKDYVETMMDAWNEYGRPEVFGIGESYYYHLGLRSMFHQVHPERSSAFCTLVTAEGLKRMKWPSDDFSFTDIELWKQLNGKTFIPNKCITLGIKGHNQGHLFGGIGHNDKWGGYKNNDKHFDWLGERVDEEAFKFYTNIR